MKNNKKYKPKMNDNQNKIVNFLKNNTPVKLKNDELTPRVLTAFELIHDNFYDIDNYSIPITKEITIALKITADDDFFDISADDFTRRIHESLCDEFDFNKLSVDIAEPFEDIINEEDDKEDEDDEEDDD